MTTHQPENVVSSSSAAVRARLQLLDARLARLRATRERLTARATRTERKQDTRRKIVLGGAVLAAIDHEGSPAIRTRADLVAWLERQLRRPQDRRVFDLPPHPSS